MKFFLPLEEVREEDRLRVGGKAFALARLHLKGIRVPTTFCIPCEVFEAYLSRTRLRDRILLEINRKAFDQMRWEELWDVSLRVRNFFLTTPLPGEILEPLAAEVEEYCGERPFAVRSSAPGEDDEQTSFAGLHESFLNVRGADSVLKHVKLVWASLYSDAALLYRKELQLDISTSSMAVIVQELIPAERSGVFFGIDPSNSAQSVLESVYGLNQGLVDGDIEPDRWMLDRASGKILSHQKARREQYAVPDKEGVSFKDLPQDRRSSPPVNEAEIGEVWKTGREIEALAHRPQDMEWCYQEGRLVVLQSRAVTSSGFKDTDDKRPWYLSLHRSYENLNKLHDRIENQLIPEMVLDAEKMRQTRLGELSAAALAREIEKRQEITDRWNRVYWAEFIPFAHGIRLFGQLYNDAVRPEDPYEFMRLLEKTNLKSLERNRLLEELARRVQEDAALKKVLAGGEQAPPDSPFGKLLQEFVSRFGDLACQTSGAGECRQGSDAVVRLVLEYARKPSPPPQEGRSDVRELEERFLQGFSDEKKAFAKDILRLGRASYRLRDDDNIHLGRIESGLFEAVREARSRLSDPGELPEDLEKLSSLPALARDQDSSEASKKAVPPRSQAPWIQARQVVGQPAGPGIARGRARVVTRPEDLLDFKQGEVLICKAVDPNMTFVVPLAAAVVEERGGMLIHGAIIAREYGLPCVTGAPDITGLVQTGDLVTVDGFLGIVTRDAGESEME